MMCAIALCATLMFPASGLGQGRIVVTTVHASILENQIGDAIDRSVTIYLPPSYDRDTSRRYPVAYLLHGATSDPKEWLDGSYQGLDLGVALDQQAGNAEYVVVMPLANNSFGGTFYVNSAAFGHWEDFIATELVAFVDTRFRTLPTRQSRALVGQSMGGFGALYLAGRHTDTFGYVYAMSPCCLAFLGDLAPDSDRWRNEPRGWLRAMALAFSPTASAASALSSPPLPFAPAAGGQLEEVAAVAASWRDHMPLYRLAGDPSAYRKLCAIALEAGQQDEIPSVTLGAAAFSRELNRAGITHTYDEFIGGHTNRTRERFERTVLPFLARVLSTEPRRGVTCAAK